MREKLIEVVGQAIRYAIDNCKSTKPGALLETQDVADHLIANGVTIPVRCEECKQEQKCLMCIEITGNTPLTTSSRHIDFCSYGERRNNGKS